MGKLIYGIHGPFIGKVGNVIGSNWRGIPYMKSKGIRTKPPTQGEKLNRFIFAKTQNWLQPISEFLKIGFKGYTLKNQGVNAAKSFLYKNALIKNGYDTFIDPTLMKVSHGDLPLSKNIQTVLTDDYELIFTWNNKTGGKLHRDDQIMMLAYNIEEEDALMTTSGQFRKTGSDSLDLSDGNEGTFHIYAAFVSVDRTSQSDSIYLGTVTTIKEDRERIIRKKIEKERAEKEEAKIVRFEKEEEFQEVDKRAEATMKEEIHVKFNTQNERQLETIGIDIGQKDRRSKASNEMVLKPKSKPIKAKRLSKINNKSQQKKKTFWSKLGLNNLIFSEKQKTG